MKFAHALLAPIALVTAAPAPAAGPGGGSSAAFTALTGLKPNPGGSIPLPSPIPGKCPITTPGGGGACCGMSTHVPCDFR